MINNKDRIEAAFGPDVASIVASIARLNPLRLVTRSAVAQGDAAGKAQQLEVLRKMLLAMVEDIRAVLVRLASVRHGAAMELLQRRVAAGSVGSRRRRLRGWRGSHARHGRGSARTAFGTREERSARCAGTPPDAGLKLLSRQDPENA